MKRRTARKLGLYQRAQCWKREYARKGDAIQAMTQHRESSRLNVYFCEIHRAYHIGHPNSNDRLDSLRKRGAYA